MLLQGGWRSTAHLRPRQRQPDPVSVRLSQERDMSDNREKEPWWLWPQWFIEWTVGPMAWISCAFVAMYLIGAIITGNAEVARAPRSPLVFALGEACNAMELVFFLSITRWVRRNARKEKAEK